MKIDRTRLIDIYRKLNLTRCYDKGLKDLAEKGLWSFYHGIIGEEAIPVGVCASLNSGDYVIPVHRTQLGVMISRGVSLPRLTAELLGREGGYCHGASGTHMACMEHGILAKTGILGAGLPVAVGVGLSIRLRKLDEVVAVFVGDGASSTGNFHEALNMAAIWDLPIIFVLENNQYAWTTPTTYALAIENLSDRASAYGILGETIDGNDVVKVYEAACRAVQRARGGEGPTLLECKTYRIMGHYGPVMDEKLGYRSVEEVKAWRKRDPVKYFRRRLIVEKVSTEEELEAIEAENQAAVQEAIDFALASPFPTAEKVLRLCREEV